MTSRCQTTLNQHRKKVMKAHFGNYDATQGRTNAVYFNVNINKVGKCRGVDNLKTKL